MLSTLFFGYLGGVALFVVTSPITAVLAGLLMVVLALIDLILGTRISSQGMTAFDSFVKLFLGAACIALAGVFYLFSRLFLDWAQRRIADRERTRHWYEEPVYRRVRRPLPRKPLTWDE